MIDGIETGAATRPAPYDLAHQLIELAFAYRSIPADVQTRAIDAFGIKGLIEIVVLCGEYVLMSMINGCFDVTEPKKSG